MAIPSDPIIYRQKRNFRVRFDGIGTAEFTSVSGLRKEVATIEFRAGGRPYATKLPGNTTIPRVQMSVGATQDHSLYRWFREVVDMRRELGSGTPSPNIYRTGEIVQYDNGGAILESIRLFDCYPAMFDAGEWDATADEVLIQQLEFEVTNWEPIAVDLE